MLFSHCDYTDATSLGFGRFLRESIGSCAKLSLRCRQAGIGLHSSNRPGWESSVEFPIELPIRIFLSARICERICVRYWSTQIAKRLVAVHGYKFGFRLGLGLELRSLGSTDADADMIMSRRSRKNPLELACRAQAKPAAQVRPYTARPTWLGRMRLARICAFGPRFPTLASLMKHPRLAALKGAKTSLRFGGKARKWPPIGGYFVEFCRISSNFVEFCRAQSTCIGERGNQQARN